jgi:hypothetical protein
MIFLNCTISFSLVQDSGFTNPGKNLKMKVRKVSTTERTELPRKRPTRPPKPFTMSHVSYT